MYLSLNLNTVATITFYLLAAALTTILVIIICRQVKEYHMQDDPMLTTLKQVLLPVHPIISKLKLYKGDKSYTINKEKIFLCLQDENKNYYPLNHLIYVLLHEVAHQLNQDDVGHTDKFYAKFDELLDRATALGVYNPSIPIVQNYCNY